MVTSSFNFFAPCKTRNTTMGRVYVAYFAKFTSTFMKGVIFYGK